MYNCTYHIRKKRKTKCGEIKVDWKVESLNVDWNKKGLMKAGERKG